MAGTNRELSIMFADVSGSTRLYERLGDERAQNVITSCLEFVAGITHRYHGAVIKTIGDEIMARFGSPDEAVRAACSIQQVNESRNHAGIHLSLRIGLHHGPAILEDDGDVFGDAVNVAARMATIAKPDQIITTGATVDQLSPDVSDKAREVDRTTVPGKATTLRICEVVWETGGDVTRIVSPVEASADPAAVLKLTYRGEEVAVPSANALLFTVGRGRQCDLVVPVGLASRVHARFEYRRGKFILVDQSTNGTFVRTQDGEEVYLRREQLLLWGTGSISLGQDISDNSEDLIRFVCP